MQLQWEFQYLSELRKTYSQRLSISGRKQVSTNTFFAFLYLYLILSTFLSAVKIFFHLLPLRFSKTDNIPFESSVQPSDAPAQFSPQSSGSPVLLA